MMNRLSQEVELLKKEIMNKRLSKMKSSQSSSGTETSERKQSRPPVYIAESKQKYTN